MIQIVIKAVLWGIPLLFQAVWKFAGPFLRKWFPWIAIAGVSYVKEYMPTTFCWMTQVSLKMAEGPVSWLADLVPDIDVGYITAIYPILAKLDSWFAFSHFLFLLQAFFAFYLGIVALRFFYMVKGSK